MGVNLFEKLKHLFRWLESFASFLVLMSSIGLLRMIILCFLCRMLILLFMSCILLRGVLLLLDFCILVFHRRLVVLILSVFGFMLYDLFIIMILLMSFRNIIVGFLGLRSFMLFFLSFDRILLYYFSFMDGFMLLFFLSMFLFNWSFNSLHFFLSMIFMLCLFLMFGWCVSLLLLDRWFMIFFFGRSNILCRLSMMLFSRFFLLLRSMITGFLVLVFMSILNLFMDNMILMIFS